MIHWDIHTSILDLADSVKGSIGIVGQILMDIPEHQRKPANTYYQSIVLPFSAETQKVQPNVVDLAVLLTQDTADWVASLDVCIKASGKLILMVGPKEGHYPEYNSFKFTQEKFQDIAKAVGLKVLGTFEKNAYHNPTAAQVYGVFAVGKKRSLTKKAEQEIYSLFDVK